MGTLKKLTPSAQSKDQQAQLTASISRVGYAHPKCDEYKTKRSQIAGWRARECTRSIHPFASTSMNRDGGGYLVSSYAVAGNLCISSAVKLGVGVRAKVKRIVSSRVGCESLDSNT